MRTQHDPGNHGTPPRAKTMRALMMQHRLLMSTIGHRVFMTDGTIIHPTKGLRRVKGVRKTTKGYDRWTNPKGSRVT